MSDTDAVDAQRLIELARAQAGEPSDWSLATTSAWLERMYAGPDVIVRTWELPTGQLSAAAAVHTPAPSSPADPRVVTVTSMLRAGSEELWDEQRVWIDSVLEAAGATEASDVVVQVLSEALVDADVARWASSGFALVFEELVMELDLATELSPRPWPSGARVLEWGQDAEVAGFEVYEAAFRDRPGFPGWTRTEWTAWLTGDPDFLPEASLCVLMDGVNRSLGAKLLIIRSMAGRLRSTRRPTAPRHRRGPAWAGNVPGPTDSLPDQIEQFLDWLRVQRNRPGTTVRAYRQDLAKFVAFLRTRPLGDDLLAGVDRPVLRRYQIELADVLPNPRSRARALVALRRFLAYAYDEGWIAAELSRQVSVPRYVVGDPHPVPTEHVPRLLAALPRETLRDRRDRALIHLLLSTGCRIAEACGLDRGDIHREGFRVLGKGGKYRTVYCTDGAFAAVEDYLRMRGPDPSPALFISVARADLPGGRALPHNRLTTDGARRALTALRRRMGVDPEMFNLFSDLRSPHAARHTAATTLLEATDGDVRLVQEVLGHATLETLKVYTEITDRRKRAAYRRLGDYLDEVAARA